MEQVHKRSSLKNYNYIYMFYYFGNMKWQQLFYLCIRLEEDQW